MTNEESEEKNFTVGPDTTSGKPFTLYALINSLGNQRAGPECLLHIPPRLSFSLGVLQQSWNMNKELMQRRKETKI